jgi:hypothetical protein
LDYWHESVVIGAYWHHVHHLKLGNQIVLSHEAGDNALTILQIFHEKTVVIFEDDHDLAILF